MKSYPISISKPAFTKLKERDNLSHLATALLKAYVADKLRVPTKTHDEIQNTSVYLDENLYNMVKEKSAKDGTTPHYVLQRLLEMEAERGVD